LFPVSVNTQGSRIQHGFTEKIRIAYPNGPFSGPLGYLSHLFNDTSSGPLSLVFGPSPGG
jgi:hypothetical protein